ncbi:MAG: tetratricopeptide repeat protein, partial [Candidatus Bathyarchaeota archaeon]|nr:tetratricopeptide repeat protein [Candidatus Bathyarchaeota archaeon]
MGIALMVNLHGSCFIAEPEKQEQHRLRVVENLHEAIEFAEGAGDAYLMGLSYPWLGLHSSGEESINHCQKAVECGEETRDSYLKATALDLLAYETYWKAFATEDPDQRRKLAEEAMEFYERAQHHFSVISYSSPRWGAIAAPGGHAEHYFHLSTWEPDPEEKLQLLEKSEKAGLRALKMAEDSDIPLIIAIMLHILSKTLESRASLESDADAKSSFLERALSHRERNIEVMERLIPFDYWDRGVMWGYLSQIRAELGYLAPDNHSMKRLLEEAASNKEKCLRLIAKAMPYHEKMGRTELFAALYDYQDSYETLLSRLYELTENPEHLRVAIEISHEAIESASKLDMVSLIAESYWKIAKAKDALGKHQEAADEFKHASENYEKAAEKIPQLRDFYQDYSSYMHAWSEIEKAKQHHAEKRYGKAKEHYEKAASLHRSTGRWDYLGSNYLAWARLEEAEDFSRMGRTEEAKDLFQQAATLFVEAKKSITPRSGAIEGKDEEEMSADLAEACDIRREYCLGRIDLEEARIMDRQGDHAASSRTYGSAARIFQTLANAMEHESDRQE